MDEGGSHYLRTDGHELLDFSRTQHWGTYGFQYITETGDGSMLVNYTTSGEMDVSRSQCLWANVSDVGICFSRSH